MDYDENEERETPGERLQKELQAQIDTLVDVLANREAALALANRRAEELSAQIAAMAEDALNWVPRDELDEKLALTEQYARAQYANRHHSRNFQTFTEWLAAMEPAL